MTDYNSEFYSLYEKYLQEPGVRVVHDFAIKTLTERYSPAACRGFNCVLDLGCGLNEFLHCRCPSVSYLGIDRMSPKANIVDDYREMKTETVHAIQAFQPCAMVSLFSTEITSWGDDNWGLYNRLFGLFSSLEFALVSGFYYRDFPECQVVKEKEGLLSFQTSSSEYLGRYETPGDKIQEVARLTLPCPSSMFGTNPVEVWRLLVRKGIVRDRVFGTPRETAGKR